MMEKVSGPWMAVNSRNSWPQGAIATKKELASPVTASSTNNSGSSSVSGGASQQPAGGWSTSWTTPVQTPQQRVKPASKAGLLVPPPPGIAVSQPVPTPTSAIHLEEVPAIVSPKKTGPAQAQPEQLVSWVNKNSATSNPWIPQVAPPAPDEEALGKKEPLKTAIEEELSKQSLYKTELCRSFSETAICRYGHKCQFAHGEHELRPILRHPKYKTELCKRFAMTGNCPYGPRCRFIHPFGVCGSGQWTRSWGAPEDAAAIQAEMNVLRLKAKMEYYQAQQQQQQQLQSKLSQLQIEDEDDEATGRGRLAIFQNLTKV